MRNQLPPEPPIENTEEYDEWLNECQQILEKQVQEEIRAHLQKFKDGGLERLLDKYGEYYYLRQKEFRDPKIFREYLKQKIQRYIDSFKYINAPFELTSESLNISHEFYDLIYDGEENNKAEKGQYLPDNGEINRFTSMGLLKKEYFITRKLYLPDLDTSKPFHAFVTSIVQRIEGITGSSDPFQDVTNLEESKVVESLKIFILLIKNGFIVDPSGIITLAITKLEINFKMPSSAHYDQFEDMTIVQLEKCVKRAGEELEKIFPSIEDFSEIKQTSALNKDHIEQIFRYLKRIYDTMREYESVLDQLMGFEYEGKKVEEFSLRELQALRDDEDFGLLFKGVFEDSGTG